MKNRSPQEITSPGRIKIILFQKRIILRKTVPQIGGLKEQGFTKCFDMEKHHEYWRRSESRIRLFKLFDDL